MARANVDFKDLDDIIDYKLKDETLGSGIFFTTVNMCMMVVIVVCIWLWLKLDKAEKSGGL